MTAFWQTATLASNFGQQVALVENEQQLNYADLHQKVQQRMVLLTTALSQRQQTAISAQRGIKALWLVVTTPTIDFVVNYLALLALRQTVWLTNEKALANSLIQWQQSYHIDFIINAKQQVECLPALKVTPNCAELTESLALLLSTSGTTGSSKLVKLSFENLSANCQSICDYLPITKSDTVITTLPLHYSFGLSVLNTHLAVGSTLVLTQDSLTSSGFWQLVKQHQVSCFYGVPFHFQTLIKLGLARIPSQNIKFFAVAGGKLVTEYAEQIALFCQQQHKAFFVMYGQTEATARISYLAPEKVVTKPTSIGQAILNGELFLVDDSRELISDINQVGQLMYRGANVMMGYAESMQDLSTDVQSQCLATGDLAYCDQDGDFYIVGRLKRMIKLAGIRISLDDVEGKLATLGYVSAVFGEDDKLVFVVESADENISQALQAIKQELSQWFNVSSHYIAAFHRVEIPTLETGKIDYQLLQQQINNENNLE